MVLSELNGRSSLGAPIESLRGASVLIVAEEQLAPALATVLLDGVARRILLCPPDLAPAHLAATLRDGEVDAVVTDGTGPSLAGVTGVRVVACGNALDAAEPAVARDVATEWVLFTSGTTGAPKMVLHSLPSLTGPLDDGLAVPGGAVWSTFYDVRRYGGLTILMRGLLGAGSMVLSSGREPVADFLRRAGEHGVTHISGTPSHWRRALMSGAHDAMAPAYVRLSGEVADQAVLDHLRRVYPAANIAHAFASTEAGVAFDVRDGLAGFPASYVHGPDAKADMRIVDGTLRIRSTRTAQRYLGERYTGERSQDRDGGVRDPDGYVDTGDLVELRGDRYYFVGRREGVINFAGQKVFPEEVEAVINQHPAVRMSRVWPRPSPITGAVVAADVVLHEGLAPDSAMREAILQTCRAGLAAHKVPASLRFVPALDLTASGKLVRSRA